MTGKIVTCTRPTRPAAISARFSDRLPCERNGTPDSSLSRATTSTASPLTTVASGQSSGPSRVLDTTVAGMLLIRVTHGSLSSDSSMPEASICACGGCPASSLPAIARGGHGRRSGGGVVSEPNKPWTRGRRAGTYRRLVSGGCRLWPELEDDVDRGLGDLPEPAEAGVVGQLPYRCRAGLGAERDPAGLGQCGRRALERGRRVAERGQRTGQVGCVVVGRVRFHDQDGAVGGERLAGVGQRGGRVAEVVEGVQQADQVVAVGRVAGRVERLEPDPAAEAGLVRPLPGDGDRAVMEVIAADAGLRV